MDPSEISLLEFAIENDKKRLQDYDLYLRNYDKCLDKEEEFLISIIKQMNEDEKHCEALKEEIKQTKEGRRDLKLVTENLEIEIQQLLAEVNQVDEMLKEKWGDKPETISHCRNSCDQDEVSRKEEKILKDTYRVIKYKMQLYQNYLGCTVNFEEPDIYVFSFTSNNNNGKGSVKFQFNNNKWEILDYDPKELLSEDDIKKFKYINDPQKLLSQLMMK